MKTLRSIGAVVAGFLTCAILSVITDSVLEAFKLFPPQDQPALYTDPLLLIATAYRTVYTVSGGYLTARLAPAKPIAHVLSLGVLGMVVGSIGAAVMWSKAAGHEWYPIALIVEAIPCCYAGGWLYLRLSRA